MFVADRDCTNWPRALARNYIVGLDIGLAQDHSALVTAGDWVAGTRSTIGVTSSKQFPLGTPLDEVADHAAQVARSLNARIVFDSSNNSAFGSLLAAHMGRRPENQLIAGVIAGAAEHAAAPTTMLLSVGGMRAAIPRWTLSKNELVEAVAAELDGGTMRLSSTGDAAVLVSELSVMERKVRASGKSVYSAPAGAHDDLVMALALATFGLRRIGGHAITSRRRKKPAPSSLAWT